MEAGITINLSIIFSLLEFHTFREDYTRREIIFRSLKDPIFIQTKRFYGTRRTLMFHRGWWYLLFFISKVHLVNEKQKKKGLKEEFEWNIFSFKILRV